MDPFTRRKPVTPYHHIWTRHNQDQPPQTALDSPLLDLARSSDVDPLRPEQVADARQVLRLRRALVGGNTPTSDGNTPTAGGNTPTSDGNAPTSGGVPAGGDRAGLRAAVLAGQRRIVERFLAGRRAHFGADQSRPLADVPALAREGRDIFLVIKFMDEAPHLAATLHSLLNQRGVDPARVVIVAVDNNSTDGSDAIVKQAIESYRGAARIVYLNQARPGAGNAARLGVDTCIATVYEMCRADDRWERLQTATIAVSDGDTVYHPHTVHEVDRILADDPTVDGVMPFLTYKFTAALRLFRDYRPAYPQALARSAAGAVPVEVGVDLSGMHAHHALPRQGRRLDPDGLRLTTADGTVVTVPLAHTDEHGRRFGVLRDPAGRLAYAFADRTIVLAEAPVSGFDAALVFLENGGVQRDEKWRWHSVIGHDLFLYWAFAGMGLPEAMVFPDTSDALKTFRVWSFAIGGQHQLRRPGLRIATGSDYQSGRVLQAVGSTVRLAPAAAFTETETDRLIKMIRNFVHRQSVFYGETRSAALERATGLYVHMTRIQDDLERELRGYPDEVFAHTVFPERVLFPLRWMLQNAVRFAAHGRVEREIVRERVLQVVFTPATAARIDRDTLTGPAVRALAEAAFSDQQVLAEWVAEQLIAAHYGEIMAFYQGTLRSFLTSQQVAPECFEWLLDGVTASRNAIVERPPTVDAAAVWAGKEFDIDIDRGQVVRMLAREGSVEHHDSEHSGQ